MEKEKYEEEEKEQTGTKEEEERMRTGIINSFSWDCNNYHSFMKYKVSLAERKCFT